MGDIRAGLEDIKLDVALFADVKYFVSGEADPKILSLLQKGGAECSNYFSTFVTHLIAGYEALENDISQAKDLYEIPAVTHDWVIYSAKCQKLLPTKYFSAEENQLFTNIRACLSQVSNSDCKSLWAMITLQGGKCQIKLDRYCTHLITGKANGPKYEAAMRHNLKIVTPDWITDCCKKRTIVSENDYHPRLLIHQTSSNSTAMITGFMDNQDDNCNDKNDHERTKAMLEQLKQRMPWNQTNSPMTSSQTSTTVTTTNQQNVQLHDNTATSNAGQLLPPIQRSSVPQIAQQQQQQQQQQQFQRSAATPTVPNYSTPISSASNQNWHNQMPQVSSALVNQQPIKQSPQLQQQQQQPDPLSQGQSHLPPAQMQINNQMTQQSMQLPASSQLNQQMPMNFPQQVLNQQQQPQLTSPTGVSPINQQQMQQQGIMQSQQQTNIQMSQHQQSMLPQQKTMNQLQMPQQVNQQPQLSPLPQAQSVNAQVPQQALNQQAHHGQMVNQQVPQHIQQQQMVQQAPAMQPQQAQAIAQQSQAMPQQSQPMSQQPQQAMVQQNQIPQQIGLQQQLPNQQAHQMIQQQQQQQTQQELTPEQRQQLLALQQQQTQQQKIQQISQQLQQSAPQASQQFIIRDGQLQQQSPNQLINQNQQGFIVNREVWQQQQYHLQLQRQQQQQQQQQQMGQQRPGGQWNQQPPQPPRQLIQLDAQTHQQLQQMDPQQRAQFIQKIQKQRNLLLQRQMQNRQTQGPHAAVIRTPDAPGQARLQWVQQRPQMMGPQVAAVAGQKPIHPGVQPPALTPINPPNQVIIQSGQSIPIQSGQNNQSGQTFQQGQLTPQQIAQLHLQKQQHMARLQQLQHLQQQQQQQQPQQIQSQAQPLPPPVPQPPQQSPQPQPQSQPQLQLQSQQSQVQQPQQPQQSPVQSETPLLPLTGTGQMPQDQQLVVNAKTKTALANMLTNRLQGGATDGSAAGQLRLMTAQHRPPPPPLQDAALLAAYQRRSLGNLTNGGQQGQMKMQYSPSMSQPKAQFYGHNPNLKLPPDLFLLGCIFVIVEYETHYSTCEVSNWRQVIERHGGEVEPQYCSRATHVLAITQKHPIVVQALREGKRCVSAHWLSDVVSKQQVVPPWHALHFPIPYNLNELPCPKQNISFSGFEGEERAKIKSMLDVLGIKFTTYFSHHNTLLISRRSDGLKYKKAREWQISIVNAQWLTDLICGQVSAIHQIDAPKYQQFNASNPFRLDYSLVPHLMAAWKMPINISQESYDKVKQVGQGPNAMRRNKKPRLDGPQLNKDPHLLGLDEPIVITNPDPPTPDKQPRILFSGTNPRKYAKRIRELGGALAASWRDATHLVMPSAYRTVKFLCCLSRVKYIVNIQWLNDCFSKNTFVDESSYALGGAEFEKTFLCNIESALASQNRGSVLKGLTFYVTPSVVPSPAAFSEIIESAGGIMEKARRSLVQIQEMNSGGKLNYLIITQENDLHLLTDVLQANINVFNAELVLRSIARQNFQIDANQL